MRRVSAWIAADLDAYMACWTDDMVITLPSGEICGRDRYRRLVAAGFEWAQPVSFDVHHLAFDDAVALADWTIRARRRADDVLIEWRGLSVCEFTDDGRIRRWREHHLAPPAPVV
jgi:ketosteroid isomerase-like protein